MADLFASIAASLEQAVGGYHGDWSWTGIRATERTDPLVVVRHRGLQVATLQGPDRYDYLIRLMVADPDGESS